MMAAPAREAAADLVEIEGFRFPRFDLARLFRTVFQPGAGERVAVFTDLVDPADVVGRKFLDMPGYDVQRHAWHTLYEGLLARRAELALAGVDFYGYEQTGGSNLDLPETVTTLEGKTLSMREAFTSHTIVIFMGTYSATAPATALAKELSVRGATMHGANDKILATGLAVDYEQVSARAERLRRAMSHADRFKMEWTVPSRKGGPKELSCVVELGRQEAQKSHGLVRGTGDIANLPAGEVYFVPTGAEGHLPRQLEDDEETIAIYRVSGGKIVSLEEVVRGSRANAEALITTIADDPNVGAITELGLGTQSLPFSGQDIQDEKVLGTAHLATGRSDHLGGKVGPKAFKHRKNASHNDILWAPLKTPAVELTRVSMEKDGKWTELMNKYQPSEFVKALL